jgi:hypothetical protein
MKEVNVDARNSQGLTPMKVARTPEMTKLLLSHLDRCEPECEEDTLFEERSRTRTTSPSLFPPRATAGWARPWVKRIDAFAPSA